MENSFFVPGMVRVVTLSMRPAELRGTECGWPKNQAGIAACGEARVSRPSRMDRIMLRTWSGRG